MTPQLLRRWALVGSLAVMAGCGGGGSPSAVGSPNPPPPGPGPAPAPAPGTARGSVVSTVSSALLSKPTIDAQTGIDPALVNDTAHCTVQVLGITYATVNTAGALVTASAALLVPTEVGCAGPHPLLSHQHGTSYTQSFNSASLQGNDTIALQLAALYASHGYVVVIPDYLGYNASAGSYHPYVQAEAAGAVVVDALRAARNWTRDNSPGTVLSGDVYLSGTSEGGFNTMATQRAIELDPALRSEFTLRATAPTSGPYQIANTVLGSLTLPDDPTDSDAMPGAFILYGLQRTYGDIYSDALQVFQAPWAPNFQVAGTLQLPGTLGSEAQYRSQCVVPFNLKDNPSQPIGNCSRLPLLQPTYVADYLNSRAGTPGGTARAHAEANNLLQVWQPLSPVTVCYGSQDPSATSNALAANAYFTTPNTNIENIETDSRPLIANWMSVHRNDPLYHGVVEASACTSFTRNYVFPILY